MPKASDVGAIDLPPEGQETPESPETPEEGMDTPEEGGEGNEGGDQPEGGEGGEGKGEAPPSIKVGDKTYTADQIAEMEKKGSAYDTLLPEFTRKSQDLAKLKGQDGQPPEEDTPFYLKEGWKPANYAELQQALKMATEAGQKAAVKELEKMQETQGKAKEIVDNFVAETKKNDKEFDEDDFFDYIQRHRIKLNTEEDLKAIYGQYVEVREAKAKIPKVKGKDIVSPPGGGKGPGLAVPIQQIRQHGSAQEAAAEALAKIKNK